MSTNTNLINDSWNLSILDLGHGMILKSAINALMIVATAVYAFEAKTKKVGQSEIFGNDLKDRVEQKGTQNDISQRKIEKLLMEYNSKWYVGIMI